MMSEGARVRVCACASVCLSVRTEKSTQFKESICFYFNLVIDGVFRVDIQNCPIFWLPLWQNEEWLNKKL